jgi:hypothetical protein
MRNQRGLIADRNEDARHDRVGVAIVSKRTALSWRWREKRDLTSRLEPT